jgi:uncharacterized repeat protein (TIGR03803 family)
MTKRMACIVFLLCAAAVSARAQTFNSLASFDGTDGYESFSWLAQGTDGNLYGTTELGGISGDGTVFKLTPEGALTTMHNFCSLANCADGSSPYAGLILAADGDFYGTTAYGGANGCGTVFKITTQGNLTTLYSFCSLANGADGNNPNTGVLQATDGNFYGTTVGGGAGYGTAFKMTPQGTLTTLYKFLHVDGATPSALVQGANGNFYGTTAEDGAHDSGTVFQMTPQGRLTTLYSFCSQADCADGKSPEAALVQATNGNFYGTAWAGGASGDGTVFEITVGGTLTTLYSFDFTDGQGPSDGVGLVQATDGNFYGETSGGGAEYGTVFEITPSGTLTTLHTFGKADGEAPLGGLVQATDGSFYGTTVFGGTDNDGTVFSLSVGLSRFVETIPAFGKVGENITILGNALRGSTSVSFNGTPATTFTTSNAAIKVTVPTGATTGSVQVVTASGTVLGSNAEFRVIP